MRQILVIIIGIFLIGGFLTCAAFLAERIEHNSHYENVICASLENHVNGSFLGWVTLSFEMRINTTRLVVQNTQEHEVRSYLEEFFAPGELVPCYASENDIELSLEYMPWMAFIMAGILVVSLVLFWLNEKIKKREEQRNRGVHDFDVL